MEQCFEQATLGGGCFWCLEAGFERVRGVLSVVSGYAGGSTPDPTYEQVCTGRTGHAEVVQITFDPVQISFSSILEVFWALHDPTTPGRQGHDVGTQYRSIILAQTPEQQELAIRSIAQLEQEGVFPAPIVTEVELLTTFYPAEADHQGYYRKNPNVGYCQVVIQPKLAKLREKVAGLLI